MKTLRADVMTEQTGNSYCIYYAIKLNNIVKLVYIYFRIFSLLIMKD